MRTQPRQGGAQRLVWHLSDLFTRSGQGCGRGLATSRLGCGQVIDRTLPQTQATDASPTEMSIDARQDLIGHMLKFERKATLDAHL